VDFAESVDPVTGMASDALTSTHAHLDAATDHQTQHAPLPGQQSQSIDTAWFPPVSDMEEGSRLFREPAHDAQNSPLI
jgi:hypothetical protein